MTKPYKKCVIKECHNHGCLRGLCTNCYSKARRLVKQNRTTWEFLEKHDMALSSAQKMKGTSAFSTQFNEIAQKGK